MNERIDLTNAVVVTPDSLSRQEEQAIIMLLEEAEKRTCIRWKRTQTWPSDASSVIAVTPFSHLGDVAIPDSDVFPPDGHPSAAEGYHLCVRETGVQQIVWVVGNDPRGVLFGVGKLLRTLCMARSAVSIRSDLDITTAPHYPLRGHQLGYRDKTNSYCAWDLEQWEQYIRDLVVFGANAIELIPPRSDDKLDSVHFPLPPMQMMVGMSQLAENYGIDVWIWFPALDKDYSDPATVEFALNEWGDVFHQLPRVDAVFVPGGDPGKTHPEHLMPLLAKQKENLNQYHPNAELWVSPQGFTPEWFEIFLKILRDERPTWLDGVVHGPWVNTPIADFRRMVPEQYRLRNYPDITHTRSCQFPVPNWDAAYALTEGREPINPRPLAQAAIFRHTQPPADGFLTYCEGCNDDVNKCVWSALGWNPDSDVYEVLREYSRYYIGEEYADGFAQGLLALEQNWEGPLLSNTGVNVTLQQFQSMESAATPQTKRNWRFQQGLYRAYYDAYIRTRLIYETNLEAQAMAALRQGARRGSQVAVAEAERILDLVVCESVAQDWRTRIFQLAEALFQSVQMQLSVELYDGQEEVRGANLDGIDYPLNNTEWLELRFAEIRELLNEEERLSKIQEILDWTNPGPGGFYDDLGNGTQPSHVIGMLPFDEDPAFLRSPVRKFSYRKSTEPQRISWRGHTGTLQNQPFEMCYPRLDPEAQYRIRIVYSAENPQIPVRLDANDGIEVHPWLTRPQPRGPMEFEIPKEATCGGTLVLRWRREPGHGGIGTGCDVSEIWLIRE